jgi:hypothetical protein
MLLYINRYAAGTINIARSAAAPSGAGIVPSVRRLIGFSAGRATSHARLRCQPGELGKCPVEGYSHISGEVLRNEYWSEISGTLK